MAVNKKILRPSAEQTRMSLIMAGLRLFGEKGFDATSTRDIAAAAEANIASISYHFANKEGLRLACAEAIVIQFRDNIGSTVFTANPGGDGDKALLIIETALTAMIRFLTMQPEARNIAAFMMREMTSPGAAVDLIYSEMIEPFHTTLCRLWSVATGCDPHSQATRLTVFTFLGQVLYFRIGQPFVLKRMDWRSIGAKEADKIIVSVTKNLRALASTAKAGEHV